MSMDIVDLEELVRQWAIDFPLDKNQKKEADDIKSHDINWKHMRIIHGKTEYLDQIHSETPKSHVLFTANFSNDTDQKQMYSLRTERRTKSTCNLSMSRSYCYGMSADIKLTPPNPIIEANAGFKGELTLANGAGQTFEEELTWSIDNQITVPPKCDTKASLVIKEDEYMSHFKSETKFEGKIHVTLRSKRDDTTITTLTAPIKQIFTADKGFRVDKTGVYYEVKGSCKCRFGSEQYVKLSQSSTESLGNGEE